MPKKKNIKLSEEQWDSLSRGIVKYLVKISTPERGDATRLSKVLNARSSSAVPDMRTKGKASLKTFTKLIAFALNWSDDEAHKNLKDPKKLIDKIKKVGSPGIVEELISEILKNYPKDEVIAWLKLLLAKAKVEKSLNLEITARTKK